MGSVFKELDKYFQESLFCCLPYLQEPFDFCTIVGDPLGQAVQMVQHVCSHALPPHPNAFAYMGLILSNATKSYVPSISGSSPHHFFSFFDYPRQRQIKPSSLQKASSFIT